jgi:choice-of-anchor B domain-containing protein
MIATVNPEFESRLVWPLASESGHFATSNRRMTQRLQGRKRFSYLYEMRYLLLTLIAIAPSLGLHAQLNMTELSNLSYFQLHNADCNDVWGYVDEMGNEYALVGTTEGVGVVNVTNPAAPVEVLWAPGMNSIWRDIKTWGDFAYVTTEAQQGLMIIDLSPLPASTTLPVTLYTGPLGNEWQSAHNLWIDEFGYAYISGANRGNGGVIILDVHTTPGVPVEVGEFDAWYSHDCWVIDDTMYAAHISDGFFSIVDVSDRSNPQFVASAATPGTFSHNIWGNNSHTTVFTTDEIGSGYLASYDVSNPANITELDRTQSSPGSFVIPHNTHFLNDYIITSYYRDGVTVHDVSDPQNMILTGHFDTSPNFSGYGFNGCWGAYPYLPSGNILATDIERGLYVLGISYQRGCYLQGVVTDANTTFPIGNAEARILGEQIVENSRITGLYKTGLAVAGTYDVRFSKPGYFPDTVQVTLTDGVVTVQDIALVPMVPFTLSGQVLEAGTLSPVNGATVRFAGNDFTYDATTNAAGNYTINGFYQGDYFTAAGQWGHRVHCKDMLAIDGTTGSVNFLLEPGYYDDFSLDLGWTTSGNATDGLWVREVPLPVTGLSAPQVDGAWDCGGLAYLTGNEAGHADNADVDEGWVLLESPSMDLSALSNPHVNYLKWFFNKFGPAPEDDSLMIFLNDGTQSHLIDWVTFADEDKFSLWLDTSIRVQDHITALNTVKIQVYTSDLYDSLRNITEAGFDYFFVSEGPVVSGISDAETSQPLIYPNPVAVGNEFQIQGAGNVALEFLNPVGSVVSRANVNNGKALIPLSLSPGVYLVRWQWNGRPMHQTIIVTQ